MHVSLDAETPLSLGTVNAAIEALLEEGAAAPRDGDGGGARRAFDSAIAVTPTGGALEGLGGAAYLELAFPECVEHWERAYAAYRTEGNQRGAIRIARKVAFTYGAVFGDAAVMNGWFSRALTLLERADESAEGGWVALNRGMFEDDRATRDEHFSEALAAARTFGDTDLEFATLAYLGASLVHDDRTEEGMLMLDEALAAVAGDDVEDFFILEEIFCQLFSACEHAHDVIRAEQWIRIGDDLAVRRKLPSVSAFRTTSESWEPRRASSPADGRRIPARRRRRDALK